MSRRHPATKAFLALTGIFALGAFIQPFTAGLGIFGDDGDFGAHQGLGWMLHTLTLVALVVALVAPTRRRDAPLAAALVVLVTLQVILVNVDATPVQALHPLLGVASLLLAIGIHLMARTSRATVAA